MYEANQSEIARLRQEMEATCEAMRRGLIGYSITANHEFIKHKYDVLGAQFDALKPLVGEEAALTLLIATYDNKIK
jgi:hypothetical protein